MPVIPRIEIRRIDLISTTSFLVTLMPVGTTDYIAWKVDHLVAEGKEKELSVLVTKANPVRLVTLNKNARLELSLPMIRSLYEQQRRITVN